MRLSYEAVTVLKTVYLRITLTNATLIFFLISFIHCLAQGLIQSFLYTTDANSSSLVSAILHEAQISSTHELAWLRRPRAADGGPAFLLSSCAHVPLGAEKDSCSTVFDSRVPLDAGSTDTGGRNGTVPPEAAGADTYLVAHFNASDAIDGVQLFSKGSVVFLNEQCTQVLVYADQVLKNAKREELALIGSQFWLFVMSFYGIMYESIPHILAALASRVLATGWSAYAIWRTEDIHTRFRGLITGPQTPCHHDLFPNYFKQRSAVEIPDLVLNCLALMLSAYLSYKLVKTYNAHTLQRICPTADVLRLYRFFMGVSASLHLSIFFLFSAMGLWVDQLANGAIAHISTHTQIYMALFIFTTLVLVPWLFLGRAALARESTRLLWTFQGATFVLVVCWGLMFYSRVFRWTFLQWPFLGCVTVASFLGVILAALWAEVGRRCFGRGLRHFLHVNEELTRAGFEPEVFAHEPDADVEKAPLPFESLKKDELPETFLPVLDYKHGA